MWRGLWLAVSGPDDISMKVRRARAGHGTWRVVGYGHSDRGGTERSSVWVSQCAGG